MNSTFKQRKFEVGCSGSGWGVWEIETGQKVEGFGLVKMIEFTILN